MLVPPAPAGLPAVPDQVIFVGPKVHREGCAEVDEILNRCDRVIENAQECFCPEAAFLRKGFRLAPARRVPASHDLAQQALMVALAIFRKDEGCDRFLGHVRPKLLRNFISFCHQCLPRSGMGLSPQHPGSSSLLVMMVDQTN
jgi:hypothetical protein